MRRKAYFLRWAWLMIAVFPWNSAAQNNPTLSGDYSGDSHLILGEQWIKFEDSFLYQAEQDNTFVAMFGQHEILEQLGGSLSSTPGEFGVSNDGAVGGTAGSFDVSPSGAATYSIPILVSPGTNGMEPNVSIVYGSQGPDGLLGKGFSLAGSSAITRVKATDYHDGFTDQVDFDEKDRLALDGERMILHTGVYGTHASGYRLENNRMAKIVAYGSDGISGFPQYFKVWEKSGLIKTYGATADSRHDLAGLGALTWALNKVEDRAGNYMTYHYAESDTEQRLVEIRYTGNTGASLETYAHVVFEYADRANPRTFYVYGKEQQITKRLTNIKSYYGAELLRDYRLSYEEYDAMPHLTAVTEFNSAGEHYNPIRFDWNEEGGRFRESGSDHHLTVQTGEDFQTQSRKELIGDFTGDGKADMLAFFKIRSFSPVLDEWFSYEKRILFEEREGRFVAIATDDIPDNSTLKYLGDFNGDGLTDYASLSTDKMMNVYYSNGVGFTSGFSSDLSQVKRFDWLQVGDFDGDGKSDLVIFDAYEYRDGRIIRFWSDVLYNENENFATDKGWSNYQWAFHIPEGSPGPEFLIQDFNGDGKADIYSGLPLLQNDGPAIEKVLLLATTDPWEFQIEHKADWPDFTDELIMGTAKLGDFNGDGLFDILDVNHRMQFTGNDGNTYWGHAWKLYLGNAKGFEDGLLVRNPELWPSEIPKILDYDGDGRSDLMIETFLQPDPDRIRYEIFDVLGENPTRQRVDFDKEDDLYIADFTGNGVADILVLSDVAVAFKEESLCGQDGSGPLYCQRYSYDQTFNLLADFKTTPTMVKAIANSYGSRIYLDYLPLTDDRIYTKYADATGELLDVQMPMHATRAVYADNGVGGLSETRYHYKGAKVHRHGKGYLGFAKRIIDDITQSLQTTESYEIQTSHYVPLLTHQEVVSTVTGNKISSTDIDYVDLPDGLSKTFLFAKQREVSASYDLYTGDPLVVVTSDYQEYDAYGNVTRMQVGHAPDENASPSHTTTTENTYSYTGVAQWILGRLAGSTVTKTAPSKLESTRTSSFTYNGNHFLETETIQPGHDLALTTSYTYDVFGNILTTTSSGEADSDGTIQDRSMTLAFDAKGRFVELERNDLGHESTRTFDHAYGNVLTETGPNGRTTTYAYDDFGRLETVTAPNTNVTATTSYNWVTPGAGPPHARYLVHTSSSVGPPTWTYYDRLNRPIREKTTNFQGTMVLADTRYNSKGQVYKSSDSHFDGQEQWTTYSYDAIGRVISTKTPSGLLSTQEYMGRVTRSTVGDNPASVTVNVLGQETDRTDPGGHLAYEYFASGALEFIEDPAGNKTSFQYDVLGNRTQVIDPDLGTINTTYNAFGEVLTETDAKGAVTSFTYDVLGRQTERTIAYDGSVETTTWVYDTKKVGLVSSATTGNISQEYFYDGDLKVTNIRETLEGSSYDMTYGYDGHGRLVDLTYPTGFAVKQVYSNGYLHQVTSFNGDIVYWQADQENAKGQLTKFKLGTDIVVKRTFDDKSGFLRNIETRYGTENGPVLQHMGFAFDEIGNLTSRKDFLADDGRGLHESFVYDDKNRLKESSIAGKLYGALVMAYDDLGNITSKSDVGTYRYDGGRPHAVSHIDQNGVAIPLTEQTITYTGFDKVQEITEGDASISFTYGVNHERKITRTTFAGSTLTKRFIGGLYEEEENADGEIRRVHYIQAGGESIAIYAEEGGSSSLHYLLKDHLGSLSAIVDPQGNVVERYSYDAWGKRRDANTWDEIDGATSISYARGFTGHEHLELFSLVNMNGRVYDPVVGRFLSPDPYTQAPDYTQGLNRYSYVFNNPLSYTDPSGYITAGQVVGAAVAIGLSAVLTPAGGAAALGFFQAVGIGAAAGFAGGFTGALVDGASVGAALQAGLMSAAIGGLSAGLAHGIGTAFNGVNSAWGDVAKSGAHGVAQGALGAAFGGNFWHGFASGAIGGYAAAISEGMGFAPRLIISAVAGGATGAIAGGNFADGAITGAYIFLFNELAHGGGRGSGDRARKKAEQRLLMLGDPEALNFNPATRKLYKGVTPIGSTLDGIGLAVTTAALVLKSSLVTGISSSSWRGANGLWYRMSWGGNQWTLGRSVAMSRAGTFLQYARGATSVANGIVVLSAASNIYEYRQGVIGAGRVGYRLTSSAVAWGLGALGFGPAGLIVGVGGFLMEQAWDWTLPTRRQIQFQYWQFENALKNFR